VTRVDYNRRLYSAYRDGRVLSDDNGRLWMAAVDRHIGGARGNLMILDLGAGTGRFSTRLADAFDARVVGVEPSEKMRDEAVRGSAHPRVVYRDGSAASIPAAAGEFDFAFMSMVAHHVPDLDACAAELYRVIKPGGAVFVRNTFSGRLDSVPLYRFFRSARAIDEARLPSVEQVRDTFRARGFDFVALDTIAQQIDTSLQAHYERLQHRAISTFELMTDAEFHEGLERMRQAVELETAPAPVVERIDLLVLRRQAT
jgi:ubiquinone/menaquinone biosynthesis C-methylase UbiE